MTQDTGSTQSANAAEATSKPSTALSTEMAGVINPSPYNNAVPNTPSITRPAICRLLRAVCITSAVSAKIPPSPRLSARMTSARYLTEMITINAQKAMEATPRALVSTTGRSW